MRYVRAQDIFPAEILKLIQEYVDGECVYIPRKEDEKKSWGETTNSRQELARRNDAICRDYYNGLSAGELADKYYLSEKSIRRILLERKKIETEHGW